MGDHWALLSLLAAGVIDALVVLIIYRAFWRRHGKVPAAMARTPRHIPNSLQAAIAFNITIERSDAKYHVWLSLAEDGAFDETPFAFIAGTFDTFDEATVACLTAFPNRVIHCALEPRTLCDRCDGSGRRRVAGQGGPYGVTHVQCAACMGTGYAARALPPVNG
jgi:hypothetical protein